MFLEEVFCFKLIHLLFHPALSYNPEFHPSRLTVMHAHQPMLELYFIFICSLHSVVAEKRNFTHNLNHESLFALGQFPWTCHSGVSVKVGSTYEGLVVFPAIPRVIPEHRWSALRGFPLPPLQLWFDSTSQATFYELHWVILWVTG